MNESLKLVIDIADEQSVIDVDSARMRLAVEHILHEASIDRAQVSVAVVDDPTIHKLNRDYLEHDYATDVLSFVLERSPEHLEGQVVVSADTARREADCYGWPPEDELLLYVIHGALHLVGHDDTTPSSRAQMREEEKIHLGHFGLVPHWTEKPTSQQTEPEQ